MKYIAMILVLLAAVILAALPACAVSVTKSELKNAAAWSEKSFVPPAPAEPVRSEEYEKPRVGIEVLANYDYTTLNSRGGEPMYIGGTLYERGIYGHAPSDLRVTLPEGIGHITADIGLYAKSGGGSVIFRIEDSTGECFASPVMTQESGALPIDVTMHGENAFHLRLDPTEDGIACDQSIWGSIIAYGISGKAYDLGQLSYIDTVVYKERPMHELPFSFYYGGFFSDSILGSWAYSEESEKLDKNRVRTIQKWVDPATGLEVRCERVDYSDFPVTEWTLYFRNTGSRNTMQITDIRALDLEIPQNGKAAFLLHHADGSPCTNYDYRPHTSVMEDGDKIRLATAGGRGTSTTMPYFNLETGGKGGIIAVLGWAGQWICDFAQRDNTLRIAGGMEDCDFYLRPGEEVRSPMGLVMHYKDDWERAQNIWRQFMVAHNMPQNAKPVLSACSSHWFAEMALAKTEDQIEFIRRYREENIPISYWWMDAGWYPCNDQWPNTGTWEPDWSRFPKGLREISDYAHNHGVNIITWFEPERVGDPDSWLAKNHPDWLLGGTLLDLSRQEVLDWLIDHTSEVLKEQGIDLYRQDFNIDPIDLWRANDEKGRKGITEMKHIVNYYAYYDALIERFPGMIIDTCASGGRRNDIETLRRAVPLHRSDYLHEPVGTQNHTYGINYWIPFDGHCASVTDLYALRSIAVNQFNCLWDVRKKDLDYDMLRKFAREHLENVAPYLDGDYYALTPYSLGNDCWAAFQFHKPKEGKGLLLAFRRDDSPDNRITLRLRDLGKDKTYILTDADTGEVWKRKGSELMKGFDVIRRETHSSVLINFELKKD